MQGLTLGLGSTKDGTLVLISLVCVCVCVVGRSILVLFMHVPGTCLQNYGVIVVVWSQNSWGWTCLLRLLLSCRTLRPWFLPCVVLIYKLTVSKMHLPWCCRDCSFCITLICGRMGTPSGHLVEWFSCARKITSRFKVEHVLKFTQQHENRSINK